MPYLLAIIGLLWGLTSLCWDFAKFLRNLLPGMNQKHIPTPPTTYNRATFEFAHHWYGLRDWVPWQKFGLQRKSAAPAGSSAISISHDATAWMDKQNELSGQSGSGKKKTKKTKKR
jgi:hypothetical protein